LSPSKYVRTGARSGPLGSALAQRSRAWPCALPLSTRTAARAWPASPLWSRSPSASLQKRPGLFVQAGRGRRRGLRFRRALRRGGPAARTLSCAPLAQGLAVERSAAMRCRSHRAACGRDRVDGRQTRTACIAFMSTHKVSRCRRSSENSSPSPSSAARTSAASTPAGSSRGPGAPVHAGDPQRLVAAQNGNCWSAGAALKHDQSKSLGSHGSLLSANAGHSSLGAGPLGQVRGSARARPAQAGLSGS